MIKISDNWGGGEPRRSLEMVWVEGTNGRPFLFGEGDAKRQLEVPSFFMATVPTTQELWSQVMGGNPSVSIGEGKPVENVSWDRITGPNGFLTCIKASGLRAELAKQAGDDRALFRLPTEAEWEYAARGGPDWRAGFQFSGSNDIDAVAWCDRKHGDHTHEVARKAPNQLGLYDMSGNVWEWCQDCYTRAVANIPSDGGAFVGPGDRRILRGGCFHNWAIHCTVSKRYEIGQRDHDGCIGFRLVLANAPSATSGHQRK